MNQNPDPAEAAETGRDAWERAAAAQRGTADPAHEDFYRYGGEIVGTLTALDELAEVLSGQVAAYGNTRILRDDAGGDPGQRLSEAAAHLDSLRTVLSLARSHANSYWASIGHVGIEVDPYG